MPQARHGQGDGFTHVFIQLQRTGVPLVIECSFERQATIDVTVDDHGEGSVEVNQFKAPNGFVGSGFSGPGHRLAVALAQLSGTRYGLPQQPSEATCGLPAPLGFRTPRRGARQNDETIPHPDKGYRDHEKQIHQWRGIIGRIF